MSFPIRLDLDHDLMAAWVARQYVSQQLHLPGDVTQTVAVVVGELVTNAVLHGSPPVHLSVDLDANRVRIEVDDSDPLVGPRHPESRGLRMVQDFATNYGISHGDSVGKTIWAEIAFDEHC
jgi:two-component sensor histidine kinase